MTIYLAYTTDGPRYFTDAGAAEAVAAPDEIEEYDPLELVELLDLQLRTVEGVLRKTLLWYTDPARAGSAATPAYTADERVTLGLVGRGPEWEAVLAALEAGGGLDDER